ncbi:MAG: 5'/3'-nucleotidase SurE [Phycisphaerales bacterium]
MRILLTNDDGIHAPGLAALYEAIADPSGKHGGPLLDLTAGAVTRSPRSVVFPVAPLTVQSATSHGVTFHEPLMTRVERVPAPAGVEGIAVDGRPADCVKLAISQLWPEKFGAGSRPDLLVSGMNSGANVGINVIYSGTVAAALEAAFLGVPAIAVSLHIGGRRPRYEIAAGHARKALEAVIAGGLPRPHECLSINVPVTEAEGPMPPIRVCPMNTHGLNDQYERRTSPSGQAYYWASGHGLDFHVTEGGSDVELIFQRCITVTPLRYDLTDHGSLGSWRSRLG